MDTDVLFLVLAGTGIIITVSYWYRKTMLTGLLSMLTMFATGSYWLVLGTSLPQLAWVWYVIALVQIYDFNIKVAYHFGNEIADQWGYRWDFLRRDPESV